MQQPSADLSLVDHRIVYRRVMLGEVISDGVLGRLNEAARPASLLEARSAGGYFLQAAQCVGIAASGVRPTP
jgi:hypothetical protein